MGMNQDGNAGREVVEERHFISKIPPLLEAMICHLKLVTYRWQRARGETGHKGETKTQIQ